MKRIILSTALLAAFGASNAAVTLIGGTNLTFSGFNPTPALIGTQTTGKMDALLSSDSDLDRLHATFLGKEAVHIDQFWMNSTVVFDNTAAAPTTSGSLIPGVGAINFKFHDSSDGSFVSNGGLTKKFASYVVMGSTDAATGDFIAFTDGGKYDYVLGFNDGSNVDGDYDDLVVGFTVSAVPEPETYALMLAGLGFMGFLARRRRAA